LSITLTKFAGSTAGLEPEGAADMDGLPARGGGDEPAVGPDYDVQAAIRAAPASATIIFLSMASSWTRFRSAVSTFSLPC
jgi:hypothetical protein